MSDFLKRLRKIRLGFGRDVIYNALYVVAHMMYDEVDMTCGRLWLKPEGTLDNHYPLWERKRKHRLCVFLISIFNS